MEWYWSVLIIILFFSITGILIYLGKNGKLNKLVFNMINGITASIADITSSLSNSLDNQAIDMFNILVQIVYESVKAAENAWYNDEISAEDRIKFCNNNIDKMLEAANLQLTEAQAAIVDNLIQAACESLGHGTRECKEKLASE